MPEEICERAGLRYCVAEGVVGIGGNDIALRIAVAEDVAVGVIVRDVELLSGGVARPARPLKS